MPERFFKEKSCSGLMRGKVVDKEMFKGLIREYYTLRGWDDLGVPTENVLKEYSL
jgi:aldehyde:ferredoxin oxidoreductase